MNRNFIFASLMLAVAVNIAIIGCHRKDDHEGSSLEDTLTKSAEHVSDTLKNPYENASVEVIIFRNDSVLGGYGYNIHINNSKDPYVHQPHIPAVSGIRGFFSEEGAKKTGELVAYKIKHNIMPPSVNPQELDSLGVLK